MVYAKEVQSELQMRTIVQQGLTKIHALMLGNVVVGSTCYKTEYDVQYINTNAIKNLSRKRNSVFAFIVAANGFKGNQQTICKKGLRSGRLGTIPNLSCRQNQQEATFFGVNQDGGHTGYHLVATVTVRRQ